MKGILIQYNRTIGRLLYKGSNERVERYNLNMDIKREPNPWPVLPCYKKKLKSSAESCHGEFSVRVSRHHIIPVNLLVKFWNNLITNEEHLSGGMRKAWSAFIKQYKSFPRHDEKVEVLIQKIKNKKIVHDPAEQPPNNFDSLKQAWQWFGANLMVGPRIRSDDPGKGFEDNAYVIVGNTTFGYMKHIYTFMRTYNPISTELKAVKTMTSEFGKVLVCRSKPYPLVANNWRLKQGRYRINMDVSVDEFTEEIEESDGMEENENFVHPDL